MAHRACQEILSSIEQPLVVQNICTLNNIDYIVKPLGKGYKDSPHRWFYRTRIEMVIASSPAPQLSNKIQYWLN